MTEHLTQQIKEVARRFDGNKYIINEGNCAEHWNKKVYGKMPGVITDEEWKLNEDDDENMQTTDYQHSPHMNVVPNTYLNQMIKFEDMKKVGCTYESDKKTATHAFILTSRMVKQMDETQVT